MSKKYHSKSKIDEVNAMLGHGLNIETQSLAGEETLITGPDSERAFTILKAKGDDVFELGSSSINEKKNSAFDDAKSYIGKALKEGGHTRGAVLASIMDYGLTQSEAEEMLDIYGEDLKNADPELAELEDDMKVTKRQIAEAQAKGDKSYVIELQDSLKSLQHRYDGLKTNKNAGEYKRGDEFFISDKAGGKNYSTGQSATISFGGSRYDIVVKERDEYPIGTPGVWVRVIADADKRNAVTTDEDRRNLGKDLYGSERKNEYPTLNRSKFDQMLRDGWEVREETGTYITMRMGDKEKIYEKADDLKDKPR